MEVELITPLNNNEVVDKVYTACRTCYSQSTPSAIYKQAVEKDNEVKWKLIKHVLDSGHHSTLEHVSFTFLISDVSRALTHQLVRHRIGISYSQQSQRYCQFDDGFNYTIPPTVKRNEKALEEYNKVMSTLNEAYSHLVDLGIPAEDARMVLPNACTSNITVTVNLRELIHLCNERLCTNAQWEIRCMVQLMAKLVYIEIPELKPYLQPKCESLGFCNESAKRSCGRKPLRESVLAPNINS